MSFHMHSIDTNPVDNGSIAKNLDGTWRATWTYGTEYGDIKGNVLNEIEILVKSNQTDKLKRAIKLHKYGYHQIPKHYISPDLTELYEFLYEL